MSEHLLQKLAPADSCALNEKQNETDSLGLKNNTKLEILEVQTEKIDEDLKRLKEKSMNKWKEIASKEVTFQSKEEFDALAQKVQGTEIHSFRMAY